MITFEEVLPLLESESDEDNRLAVILIAQYDLMENKEMDSSSVTDRIHSINRKHWFKDQIVLSHNQGYLLLYYTIRRLSRDSCINALKGSRYITYSDGSIQIPEQ